MNKQSKILVMGGVLALGAANANAAATAACALGVPATVAGNPTSFIRDGFTPRCSANVTVYFDQNASRVDVHGGSAKGMHTFGGTSEGGGVVQCETSSMATPATSAQTVTVGNGGCN